MKNDDKVIIWTPEHAKKFRNALCGQPADYKSWQEYYEEGDLKGVYNCWKRLAKEEENNNSNRKFWRVIVKLIKIGEVTLDESN